MSAELIQALLDDHPFLHRDRHGAPKDGGLTRGMARRFTEELSAFDRPRIVETGTGLSTLLFLCLDPAQVISISPAPDLHERALAEADSRGIDTGPLRLVADCSESALPLLALVEHLEIDAGFIDGCHGWPAVFVDFCYLNRMLRPGGLLFVDDLQLFPVAQLVCLLRAQRPHFEFVAVDGKMATFRKVVDHQYLPDWRLEPFLVASAANA